MSQLGIQNYLKTLPEDEQRQIRRGSRLLKYIIAKRCQHPEMLAGGDAGSVAEADAEAEVKTVANPPSHTSRSGHANGKLVAKSAGE